MQCSLVFFILQVLDLIPWREAKSVTKTCPDDPRRRSGAYQRLQILMDLTFFKLWQTHKSGNVEKSLPCFLCVHFSLIVSFVPPAWSLQALICVQSPCGTWCGAFLSSSAISILMTKCYLYFLFRSDLLLRGNTVCLISQAMCRCCYLLLEGVQPLISSGLQLP